MSSSSEFGELKQGVFPALLTDAHADATTQPFWDAARQGRLVAPKCVGCGTFRLPPSPFCFECQQQDVEWVELPGTGTLYTFTVVRHPLHPDLIDACPYASGVVELDGTQGAGARMLVNIVDCDVDALTIGDRVKIVFDEASKMPTPRARPLAAEA